ncbi:hypothetical protein RQP46_007570 [Phenoliferia psychrophenolica]
MPVSIPIVDSVLATLPISLAVFSQFWFRRFEPNLFSFSRFVLALSIVFFTQSRYLAPLEPLSTALVAAGLSTATYLATLATCIVFYRITPAHKISHVPGPFVAKISQMWLVRKAIHGQIRHDMQGLHRQYGDVVRIGPNEVTINNAEAVLEITGGRSWQKGQSYDTTASGNAQKETSLIALRDHGAHQIRRRLWDKGFSLSALKGYQPLIYLRVAELVEQLHRHEGKVIDLHRWLGFFVYDAMTDLAYGGGGKMVATGTDNGILHELSISFDLAGIVKACPWILPIASRTPAAATADKFRAFATSRFMERLKATDREGKEPDIFHFLLGNGQELKEGQAPPQKLTVKELAADSSLTIMAGADTTRTVLTTIFLYMLRDPKRFTELQRELDATLGVDDAPSHEILMTIPLLEGFINEGLRLNPPLPFHVQRMVPEGGAEVAGVFLPEGTHVRLASFSIQRDPRYFKDADKFMPERWTAKKDDPNNQPFEKNAFLPFIYGPYHCPGKQFAYQEMRLLLSTIVRKFDMKLRPGFDAEAFERSWEDRTITDIQGEFPVILSPRSIAPDSSV